MYSITYSTSQYEESREDERVGAEGKEGGVLQILENFVSQ